MAYRGDRNTKYFHMCAKIKVAKARISCLVDGNEVITNSNVIEGRILGYYQHLYAYAGADSEVSTLFDYVPRLVTEDDNAMLIKVPSDVEIRQAIFDLDPSSAAGPNGFNGTFYHFCWDLIKLDICAAVQEFFRLGVIQKFLNLNLVVLLPKVKGACSVSQFRPIALSNFLFKIITKILPSRLSLILNK